MNRDEHAIIGLRCVLKKLNVRNAGDPTSIVENNPLSAILIDANALKPTAVAHLIALVAIGSSNSSTTGCQFYAIPNLSITFAEALSLPRVTVVGLMQKTLNETCEPIANLKKTLKSICLEPKAKAAECAASAIFRVPECLGMQRQNPEKKSRRKSKSDKNLAI